MSFNCIALQLRHMLLLYCHFRSAFMNLNWAFKAIYDTRQNNNSILLFPFSFFYFVFVTTLSYLFAFRLRLIYDPAAFGFWDTLRQITKLWAGHWWFSWCQRAIWNANFRHLFTLECFRSFICSICEVNWCLRGGRVLLLRKILFFQLNYQFSQYP